MNKPTQIGITEKAQWNIKWAEIFDQYQQDLRHAYYINSVLDNEDKKILEIAAGSFRDTAQLNKMGIECWGTDYSETAVLLAQSKFPNIKEHIFQSNAFNFEKIENNFFDVTFHNGFWVLFDNDADIIKLAEEQARISRHKMIVTVHNGHNQAFIEYFKNLSAKDDLYKIRFFKIDEISKIMSTFCKDVEVIPVGKGKKFHEDSMINEGKYSREELKSFFNQTGLNHIENSERLLCIGTL